MTRRGKAVSFPFYAGDWLSDPRVRVMPLAARGAYVDLLCYAFQNGGQLPAEPGELRLLVGAEPDEWRTLWRHLSKHWPVDGGVRRNPKLTDVMQRAEEYRRKQAESGAKGAERRWQRTRPSSKPEQNGLFVTTASGEPSTKRSGTPQADIVERWCKLWKDERGAEWRAQRNDFIMAAKLLDLASGEVAEIERRMCALVRSTDTWEAKNASLGLLVKRWNNLSGPQRVGGRASGKHDWTNRVEIVE